MHRIAVLDSDSCHSRKCQLECIRFCPVNKVGSECIVLGEDAKAVISEELCTGCGICIKKCPFEAITILNLAEELKTDCIHRYGINTFRLYRLPIPKKGAVVGLVGRNGIGKTTALNVLSGTLKPNLGRWDAPPEWDEVIDTYQGTELKQHLERVASRDLKTSTKPQAVYQLPKVWTGDGRSLLDKYDERGVRSELITGLALKNSMDRKLSELSGGELQRLAVAVAASREADLYLFDEPTSYNDIFQRMAVASVIRSLAHAGKSVILVEHDLTFLDYMSDYVHILYGDPGVYGVVSGILSSRTGINVLLDGFLPGENVRFRDTPVTFESYAMQEENLETPVVAEHTEILKEYPGFRLRVSAGSIRAGETVGVLGANALGKTTFMKILAGVENPDSGTVTHQGSVSYKPQYLSADYEGTVEELLQKASGNGLSTGPIQSMLVEPLNLKRLFQSIVSELSGGELQKVAIASTLMADAEIYALDEPSAFLDIEDRITIAKAIQRFVRAMGRSAMIVDHDIQLIDIVSDRVVIFTGEPGVSGEARTLQRKSDGMNLFLKGLQMTYRRDPDSGRPRVNKPQSKLDREQKSSGYHYYMPAARTQVMQQANA